MLGGFLAWTGWFTMLVGLGLLVLVCCLGCVRVGVCLCWLVGGAWRCGRCGSEEASVG